MTTHNLKQAIRISLGAGCALLLCLTAACNRQPENPSRSTTSPPTTEPTQGDLDAVKQMLKDEPSSGSLPPGHPPLDGSQAPPPPETPALPPGHPPIPTDATPGTSSPPTEDQPLSWNVPKNWKPQQPSSRFRLAQYAIPKQEGDPDDGVVAVFHFPNSGGSVAANLERWAGQFSTADGKPIPPQSIQRETFEANGLTVHTIELTGFMQVGTMMGGTGKRSEVEYRLLGAIVETPGGHWFFKGTGPAATMAAARDDFLALLKSVHR